MVKFSFLKLGFSEYTKVGQGTVDLGGHQPRVGLHVGPVKSGAL